MKEEERRSSGILIDVLGETYTVYAVKKEERPSLFADERVGYCDRAVKEIVVENFPDEEGYPCRTEKTVKNQEFMLNEVLRHELTHAFFGECGVGSDMDFSDEMLVDWIALQAPKLMRLFCKAKAFSEQEMDSFVEAYRTPNKFLDNEEEAS